jgi:hypothetical protein
VFSRAVAHRGGHSSRDGMSTGVTDQPANSAFSDAWDDSESVLDPISDLQAVDNRCNLTLFG